MLVALVVVALALVAMVLAYQALAPQILGLAAVLEAIPAIESAATAALVLSSCPFQQLNTQAQPQAHQQSPQAAQIQF